MILRDKEGRNDPLICNRRTELECDINIGLNDIIEYKDVDRVLQGTIVLHDSKLDDSFRSTNAR